MKRIWIILLAIAVALAIAVPAGAKKPDKPDDGGFKPAACAIEDEIVTYQFTVVGSKTRLLHPYTVTAKALGTPSNGDVLCTHVALTPGSDGTLSDLRLRWLDDKDLEAGASDLYWARGKTLSSINNGGTFAVGISLDGWETWAGFFGSDPDIDDGALTVVVMPKTDAKSQSAQLTVEVGFDREG
jgi:hypothetical protein